jgi:HK97 gp10 family phage protein
MAKSLVEGAQDLRDLLRNYAPNEARNIMRATVHGVAGFVRDVMKGRIKKKSHQAEKSIKAVRRRGSETEIVSDVRGGATAPYLIMLNYGTSNTEAQPFIEPTVEEVRPDLPKIYREEFGDKLVKSIARKAKKDAMS